jgi:hypothetical protein
MLSIAESVGLRRQKSPKLDRLLQDLHLPWPIIVTKWFICLFAEVLPVEVKYFFCLNGMHHQVLLKINL